MELSVIERIVLMNVLPEEANILTAKIVKDLMDAVGFTEEEHAILKFREEGGRTKWEPTAEFSKEFEFGRKALSVITEALGQLDVNRKLTPDHVSLWTKFMDDDQDNVVELDGARTGQ
jgi:hypothetical protein